MSLMYCLCKIKETEILFSFLFSFLNVCMGGGGGHHCISVHMHKVEAHHAIGNVLSLRRRSNRTFFLTKLYRTGEIIGRIGGLEAVCSAGSDLLTLLSQIVQTKHNCIHDRQTNRWSGSPLFAGSGAVEMCCGAGARFGGPGAISPTDKGGQTKASSGGILQPGEVNSPV